MGNEVEFFIKQIESNIRRTQQGKIIYMPFVDEQKQELVKQKQPMDIDIILDGGFLDAEYKRIIFVPKTFNRVDSKIRVYQILYNPRYVTLHHRKVLGALLGLGIERSSIGDILFLEDKVYFACTEEISEYILNSFKTIGGVPIELEEKQEKIQALKNLRIELHILSSLRLDVLVASAYHLSRATASTMILEGLVLLNHLECKNSSKQVNENDIISVRHKGRFRLMKIEGKTRSEKIKATLGFYI